MEKEPVHVKMVSSPEDFRPLKDAWNGLLAESPADSFFLRWEWLFEWWKAYGDGDLSLSIILVYRGGSLIGIGPFYVNNRCHRSGIVSTRCLMFLGTTYDRMISEYLDIIYRGCDSEEVIRSILNFVIREDVCTDMFLQKVNAGSGTFDVLKRLSEENRLLYKVLDRETSPYISLPDSYDQFLRACKSRVRSKIRCDQRRLAGLKKPLFRKTAGLSELDADIDELVRLHQARWESKKMPGAFSDGKFLSFQRSVMREMLKNGHLELSFLSVDGRNIASLYNIRYGGKTYFYQSGLDASFCPNISPGLLLHNFCIMGAIGDGLKEYDFLLDGKTDAYKKRWTSDFRCMHDIYMARPGIAKLTMQTKTRLRGLYHYLTDGPE